MDIYENIIIGNFLFGLGFELGGRRAAPPKMTVNLLQETHLDKPLGDVLLGGSSFYRLIEFKRKRSKDDKERRKLSALEGAIAAQTSPYYGTLSRNVHWYVESENASEFTTKVVPYIDQRTASPAITFEDFIVKTAEAALNNPLSQDEAADCVGYLKFAASVGKTVPNKKGDVVNINADSGCLLIARGRKDGLISFAPMGSVSDLLLPTNEFIRQRSASAIVKHDKEPQPQVRAKNPSARDRSY